jgi:hypothetical protein
MGSPLLTKDGYWERVYRSYMLRGIEQMGFTKAFSSPYTDGCGVPR